MVTTFLPLMPALLIFGRKLYLQEPLNFLLIICLLGFFKGFLELAYPLTKESQYTIDKIFSLILFLLLVQCFRANLSTRYRYGVDVLLSAVVSAAISYWVLKGWENVSPIIDILLNVFLGSMIMVSLPAIIRTGALQIFRSPRSEGGVKPCQITDTTTQINDMQTLLSQQLEAADAQVDELQSQQSVVTSTIQALDYTTYGQQILSSQGV